MCIKAPVTSELIIIAFLDTSSAVLNNMVMFSRVQNKLFTASTQNTACGEMLNFKTHAICMAAYKNSVTQTDTLVCHCYCI